MTRPDASSRPVCHGVAALVPVAVDGLGCPSGSALDLRLGGRSLLQRAVDLLTPHVDRILVGTTRRELLRTRNELDEGVEIHVTESRLERLIMSLFDRCSESIIVVHDPCCPFTAPGTLEAVIDQASRHGAALAATPVPGPVTRVADRIVVDRAPRGEGFVPTSPQAYRRDALDRATSYAEALGIEDEAPWEVLYRMGVDVRVVPSDPANIILRTEHDWRIAQQFIGPGSNGQTAAGRGTSVPEARTPQS